MYLLHIQHFAHFECAHTYPVAQICWPSTTVRAGLGTSQSWASLLIALDKCSNCVPRSAHLLGEDCELKGWDPSLAPNGCVPSRGDLAPGVPECSFLRGYSFCHKLISGSPQRPSWGPLLSSNREAGTGRGQRRGGLWACHQRPSSFHQSAVSAQQLLISFLFS